MEEESERERGLEGKEICMCVCMYVCYVCMYVMYACMLCMHVCMYVMYVCYVWKL